MIFLGNEPERFPARDFLSTMFGFNSLILSEFFALCIICVVMVLCIKPYLHFFFSFGANWF